MGINKLTVDVLFMLLSDLNFYQLNSILLACRFVISLHFQAAMGVVVNPPNPGEPSYEIFEKVCKLVLCKLEASHDYFAC